MEVFVDVASVDVGKIGLVVEVVRIVVVDDVVVAGRMVSHPV